MNREALSAFLERYRAPERHALQRHPHDPTRIVGLVLEDRQIGNGGIGELVALLKDDTDCVSLNVRGNSFGPRGAETLAGLIAAQPFESLELGDHSYASAMTLATAIGMQRRLACLDFGVYGSQRDAVEVTRHFAKCLEETRMLAVLTYSYGYEATPLLDRLQEQEGNPNFLKSMQYVGTPYGDLIGRGNLNRAALLRVCQLAMRLTTEPGDLTAGELVEIDLRRNALIALRHPHLYDAVTGLKQTGEVTQAALAVRENFYTVERSLPVLFHAPDPARELVQSGKPTALLNRIAAAGLLSRLADPRMWQEREAVGQECWRQTRNALPQPLQQSMDQADTGWFRTGLPLETTSAVKRYADRKLPGDRTR